MFFEYRQNNSGGSFHFDADKGIGVVVFIEAPTPNVANARAQDIGLYFDGCDDGRDCSCCGDRWYPASPTDGGPVDVPSEVIGWNDWADGHGAAYAYAHSMNGTFKAIPFRKERP